MKETMCNCKHSTALGSGQNEGQCPLDTSISVGEGWQTKGQEGFYKSQDMPSSFRRTYHTPPQRIPPVVPQAPLRQRIACIPELAAGVAIIPRRLDFDDSTFEEKGPDCASCQKSCMTSGLGTIQPSYPTGQSLSKMAKTTPCKKCLKIMK